MQRLVEAAIVVLVFGVIVALGARQTGYPRRHLVAGRLLAGLAVGLLGAFVILVPKADLIPDSLEGLLEPIFIVSVTAVAIVGSVIRLLSR